jgi:1-deoxy-D-xylulose-5-phosphate synthase
VSARSRRTDVDRNRQGRNQAPGQKIAILAFGSMVAPAWQPAKLNATVANMRFVKPLDVELVKQLAAEHDYW